MSRRLLVKHPEVNKSILLLVWDKTASRTEHNTFSTKSHLNHSRSDGDRCSVTKGECFNQSYVVVGGAFKCNIAEIENNHLLKSVETFWLCFLIEMNIICNIIILNITKKVIFAVRRPALNQHLITIKKVSIYHRFFIRFASYNNVFLVMKKKIKMAIKSISYCADTHSNPRNVGLLIRFTIAASEWTECWCVSVSKQASKYFLNNKIYKKRSHIQQLGTGWDQ